VRRQLGPEQPRAQENRNPTRGLLRHGVHSLLVESRDRRTRAPPLQRECAGGRTPPPRRRGAGRRGGGC
jgi:hypothetical protein